MATLTSSQRRELQARGQKLPVQVHLGKAGLSEAFVADLRRRLAQHELVKLGFSRDVQGDARTALAEQVAAAAGAACVGVMGRTMLLYQPKPAAG